MLDIQTKIQDLQNLHTSKSMSSVDSINKENNFMDIFDSKTNKIDNSHTQSSNHNHKQNNLKEEETVPKLDKLFHNSNDKAQVKDSLNSISDKTEDVAENNQKAVEGEQEIVEIDKKDIETEEENIKVEQEDLENIENENVAPEYVENIENIEDVEDLELTNKQVILQGSFIVDTEVAKSQKENSLFDKLLNVVDFDNEETITLETEIEETITLNKSLETLESFKNTGLTETLSVDSEKTDFESVVDEEMLAELKIESVSVESEADTSGESLLQEQSAEEFGVKTALNLDAEAFDMNLQNAEKSTQSQIQIQSQDVKPTQVTSEKIIEQITKQMDGLYNTTKLNIVLKPEALGRVNIQLINTKDGLMAQFMVETPEAKDLLMKGLDGLKESLSAHGVSVDNVSVKLNNAQKSEYKQDWTEQEGSDNRNQEQGQSNKKDKEQGLFEKMMAQPDEDENGKV